MTESHITISDSVRARIDELLGEVDDELDHDYPGDNDRVQPSHTVYVPAHLAGGDTARRWGDQALELMDRAAETVDELDAQNISEQVRRRLAERPVDDLRIDLEDGYGWRSHATEDADARRAGRTIGQWANSPAGAPTSFGIRAKGLGRRERARGLRTLELVLDAAGGVPNGFVFTVPKLRAEAQVRAVIDICEDLERAHSLPAGALRFELQVESPQAIIGSDGSSTIARAIHLGRPRLSGLHYGTYDYSAACGIVSAHQSLEHPVADYAKAVMLAAAAQTGVWIADGSTQVVPVGDDAAISAAMRRHHRLVTRSLGNGYYQGWDMHPGHLVTRWLAVFGFFAAAMPAAVARLDDYFARQGSGVVDEPATARSLALVVLRGLDAGAFTENDVTALGASCGAQRLRELRASGGVLPG